MTGRHSLKSGYRFILRKPSPFTHTNTRSSIAINRNLTNNPQTNSQGSGIATLLLGYTTGGSRGFLLDFYDYHELGALGVRAGRLEAQRAAHRQRSACATRSTSPTPRRRTACRTTTPRPCELVYAGENADAPREQADALGQLRAAPRHRLGRDRATRRTCCAPATAAATSRCRYAAGNLLDQNVPDSISQNYSVETNPLVYTPDRVPPPLEPVPARSCRSSRRTTAELNAANPLVFGHAFSNETPHMDTWQVSYERQITNTLMAEIAYAGSKGSNLIWVGNINEVQPGPGLAGLAPADPAALERGARSSTSTPTNSSSYNSLQAEAEPALLARPAVPGELHLRQVARLRGLARLGRRRRGRARRASRSSTRAAGPRASTSSTASC